MRTSLVGTLMRLLLVVPVASWLLFSLVLLVFAWRGCRLERAG